MIKFNELRTMNWIAKAGKPVHVDLYVFWEIFEASVKCIDWLEDCEGIPLTDELLRKFGFAQQRARMVRYLHNIDRQFLLSSPYVNSNNGGTEVSLYDMEYGAIGKPARHVHQLQNLFYAITGEELNNIVL